MRVFAQGLDQMAGHVLPIARDPGGTRLAERALVPARRALLPDSGRLADGLPAAARFPALGRAADYPYVHADPMQSLRAATRSCARSRGARDALRSGTRAAGARRAPVRARPAPGRGESAGWISRTALCAEPRDGVLYVFMPPTAACRDYLEIVGRRGGRRPQTLDHAGAARGLRAARRTRACSSFRVTPDPGVIEVNIHPSHTGRSWPSARTFLYEQARAVAASAPRSSCSTAATPAPAAAITSCWAARRRPTRRSCAGPTCCAA